MWKANIVVADFMAGTKLQVLSGRAVLAVLAYNHISAMAAVFLSDIYTASHDTQ